MKNITTIERIAMQKTAIGKTAIEKITAKITTTALLFFLALFTLTTNLKAQAVQDSSKSGFFAGFVVLDGFQVDSTKSVSTSPTTSYRVTGYEDDETTRIDATGGNPHQNAATQTGIRALFSANCETGAASVDSNGTYSVGTPVFGSFDPGRKPTSEQIDNEDATVTYEDTDGNYFPTGVIDGETSHCFRYFYGDLSSGRSPLFSAGYEVTADSGTPQKATNSQVSAESDKLNSRSRIANQFSGLQFGYRGEKPFFYAIAATGNSKKRRLRSFSNDRSSFF